MSEREYNTVRNLHLSQLSDPQYLHLLREFMHRNFKMPMHQADAMEGGVMPS